jgi:integrase
MTKLVVLNRLKALNVPAASAGRHSDGGGLVLDVSPSGARRWLFIFRFDGKRPEMGLGGFPAVSLAEARKKANEARGHLANGVNPLQIKPVPAPKVPTYAALAEELIINLEKGWRNPKTAARWRTNLALHSGPIKDKPVNEIVTVDVLATLKPLWNTKDHTAQKFRGQIAKVLNAAKSRGLRTGDNPAEWSGNLESQLSAPKKLKRGHHRMLKWDDAPAFMAALRKQTSTGARALEFTILTCARSGESREAPWSEFNLARAIWTIPAERMKEGKAHAVPLSGRAMEILKHADTLRRSTLVFPGTKRDRPLSDMTLGAVLKRMKIDAWVSPHFSNLGSGNRRSAA